MSEKPLQQTHISVSFGTPTIEDRVEVEHVLEDGLLLGEGGGAEVVGAARGDLPAIIGKSKQ